MNDLSSIIVHRGNRVENARIVELITELLGGHLRPDAELALRRSAPIRLRRRAPSATQTPLADTFCALHLAVPKDSEGILTKLSTLALKNKLGFPRPQAAEGWQHFGHLALDAIALALSTITGPVASLSLNSGPQRLMGAYGLFASGRRLWSTCYEPQRRYSCWNGEDFQHRDISQPDFRAPEGRIEGFPAHGLKLLFANEVLLNAREQRSLLPSLLLACRPPSAEALGLQLVEAGRFVPPRPLGEADWQRFSGSFSS